MRSIIVFCTALVLSVSSLAFAQSTPNPSIDDFVSVDQEPRALVPIERLVQYPEVARRSGLEGKVMLRVLIGTDGSVDSVVVERSDYDVFKKAAVDAMQRAKYSPAVQNGTPIKVWTDAILNFKLRDGDNSPFGDFSSLIGSGKADALGIFQTVGNLDEVEKIDGIYLHAQSANGFSQDRYPASLDGVIGDSGMRQLTIFYRFENDDDFNAMTSLWNINKFNGGEVTSVSANVEFPNITMSIASDAKERTLRVVLRSK
jgi:TonB family protein